MSVNRFWQAEYFHDYDIPRIHGKDAYLYVPLKLHFICLDLVTDLLCQRYDGRRSRRCFSDIRQAGVLPVNLYRDVLRLMAINQNIYKSSDGTERIQQCRGEAVPFEAGTSVGYTYGKQLRGSDSDGDEDGLLLFEIDSDFEGDSPGTQGGSLSCTRNTTQTLSRRE